MAEEVIQKQMSLLPEYQEKYLKDLLANIYQTDEETGTITGIAAKNPLYGQPIYQTEDGSTTQDATQAMMDPDGNPVQFYETESGEYTTDASMAMMDQYGAPIFAVEGGVASPDVIGFTDPQTQAIARLTGGVDPVTGEQYESMMGSYQPFIDSSKETFDKGVSAVERSTGAYDPQGQIQYDTVTNADGTTSQTPRLDAQGNPVRSGGYEDFYDPFVEDVIDATYADIDRAGAIEGIGARAEAVGAGAYGGSRQGIVESELQRAGQLEEAYEPFARFSYMRDILSGVPSSGTSLAASATPQASFLGGALQRSNAILGGQGGSNPILGGLGSIQNVSG